jgi:hypothetical protein
VYVCVGVRVRVQSWVLAVAVVSSLFSFPRAEVAARYVDMLARSI